MLISLFPTPFGHFQFLGSARQNPKLIPTLRHNLINATLGNLHNAWNYYNKQTIATIKQKMQVIENVTIYVG